MNKVWLIIQHEFKIRVFKKSFLITTLLVPLIFPALLGGMGILAFYQSQSAQPDKIIVLDESGFFQFEDTDKYQFEFSQKTFETAKEAYVQSGYFGMLYIPKIDMESPEGFALYTIESPSVTKVNEIEGMIKEQIHFAKLKQYNVDEETLKKLRPPIHLSQYVISEQGEEASGSAGLFYGIGFFLGILIYMFVLIMGVQVMQAVIEEKISKIVEVIVSSIKPFQLMLGKIIGIGSVGVLRFIIWMVIISISSSIFLGYISKKLPQKDVIENVGGNHVDDDLDVEVPTEGGEIFELIEQFQEVNFLKIGLVFIVFFTGGYLLYGALFAAVGSAVDSLQESQQFQLPLTFPLLVGYFGLFIFVLEDPHSEASFWLSIIPFTSPVVMVGRIAFGVPAWELLLSIALLVGGFLGTTWVAGRIYRVGILTSGKKVNYKVLVKWFFQKE